MTVPVQKAPAKEKKKKEKTKTQKILGFVGDAIFLLLVLTLIFVAQPVPVKGTSMTDTVKDGEIVLMSRLAYGEGTKGMERGDVVICNYPGRTNFSFDLGASLTLRKPTLFIKRMVALPGDTVEITGGKLFVNGEQVPDPELMGSVPGDYPLRQLGEDEYFMIGDNRRTSHDSRASDVGPISRDMIMGKVKCVLFPFGNWRSVD